MCDYLACWNSSGCFAEMINYNQLADKWSQLGFKLTACNINQAIDMRGRVWSRGQYLLNLDNTASDCIDNENTLPWIIPLFKAVNQTAIIITQLLRANIAFYKCIHNIIWARPLPRYSLVVPNKSFIYKNILCMYLIWRQFQVRSGIRRWLTPARKAIKKLIIPLAALVTGCVF